jgi:hypothetical protein
VRVFDPANPDILGHGHLVMHEILKNDADLLPQVFQVVFSEINSIEQYLAFRGVV